MTKQRSSVEAEESTAAYGLKCPRCDCELVPGQLLCRPSFFSLNPAPQFDKRIWFFKSKDGAQAKTLTSSYRQTDAYRCPICELLVIPRTRASWVTGSMPNILQVGTPAAAARSLSDRLQMSLTESAELIESIYARRGWLKWIPGPVAIATFLAWWFVFGVVADALVGTPLDLEQFVIEHGVPASLVVILLSFGVAVGLGLFVGGHVGRRLVRRQVEQHLGDPLCFWCGYALQGLASAEGRVRCPECGRQSPVDRRAGPEEQE